MSTLHFMPWCRIDRTYTVGDINIRPYDSGRPPTDLDASTIQQVNTILSAYKDLQGRPIRHTTLVQYKNRHPLHDLIAEELETIAEYIALACFSALATRQYFNPLGPYCNSDCFISYTQNFADLEFVSITTRRREGYTLDAWPLTQTTFSIPVHVSHIKTVTIDEDLLNALLAWREEAKDNEWGRWQNAISCFNQANTDSYSMRSQVEWVLLCSSIEHILQAKSDYSDVAQKFSDTLLPLNSLLVSNCKRRSDRWKDTTKPLRYEWMKEFYRIRGDYAHGRLQTRQPMVWLPLEHIVLATISFPLLIRCLLEQTGQYQLTKDTLAQIAAFECLADELFLAPPQDQDSGIDSYWFRCIKAARYQVMASKLITELEDSGISLWEPDN